MTRSRISIYSALAANLLIASVKLIFSLGGSLSTYQGVLHIRTPKPLEDPTWNYIVLAFSVLCEGTSFYPLDPGQRANCSF